MDTRLVLIGVRIAPEMTTNRLGILTAALIGLALVPTVLHSYVDVTVDDGYTSSAISGQLAGMTSRATDTRAGWVKKTFDSDDWSERNYMKPDGGKVRLFVSRSYDLKRLYHHPELAAAYGFDLHDSGVERLAGLSEAPVHVLRGKSGEHGGIALYALVYDGGFIDNPYLFQLRTAGRLLFSPRRLMTLFFVHDPTAASDAPLAGTAASRLLAAAIRGFESQHQARAAE